MNRPGAATTLAAGLVLLAGVVCVFQPWAVVGLVALMVAALLASWGQLGFSLVFMMVLTSCMSGVQVVGPTLQLPDFFLFPAVLLAAGRIIAARRSLLVPMWVVLTPAAILAWNLVVSLNSHPPTFQYLFQFVGFLLLVPLVVGIYADSPRRLHTLGAAYLASATLNALFGTLDKVGIWHLSGRLTHDQGSEFSGRVSGFTSHSNQLGLLSAMAIPFALYYAGQRRWVAATLPILLLGVAVSGSRGGLIGIPLSAALYVVIEKKNVAKRLLAGFAAMVVGLAFVLALNLGIAVNRLLTDPASASTSDEARLERLSLALSEIVQHPITGVGFGSARAHNTYIEIARDGGIPTTIIFLFFVFGATRLGMRLRSTTKLALPALAAQSTWLVLALQHNGLFERFLFVPTGLLIGAAIVLARHRSRTPAGTPATSRPAGVLDPTGARG